MLLINCHYANSATITVSNLPDTPWENSLQNAVNTASNGDTILVQSSSTSYGSIEINQALTIIGELVLADFTVKSSNVYIAGFEGDFTLDVYGTPGQTMSDVIIRDCRIEDFEFLGAPSAGFIPATIQDIQLINNWFNSGNYFYFGRNNNDYKFNIDSISIVNNMFSCRRFTMNKDEVEGEETIFFRNNTFFNTNPSFSTFSIGNSNYSISGAYIENNIFFAANPNGCIGCTFNNNMTFGQPPGDSIPGADNFGAANIIGVYPQFTNPPTACDDNNFTIIPSSPAVGAGSDGTDIGISGGAYPFDGLDLPDWPMTAVLDYTNLNTVAVTSTMDLTVTVQGTSQSIPDYAEYFVDTDPGAGNGIPIVLDANLPETPISFSITASSYGVGYHYVYARVRDTQGRFSIPKRKLFYVYEDIAPPSPPLASDIASAEYFIDYDPGAGNGVSIPITPGSTVDYNFDIPLSDTLQEGYHYIYVRTFDDLGRASIAERKRFYVFDDSPPPSSPDAEIIVRAEYFIDTDPGVGNGESIDITQGLSVSGDFDITLTDIEEGYHYVYVRVWDALDRVSIAERKRIYIYDESPPAVDTTSSPIVYAEYFIDTDPGVGNGESITLTDSTDIQSISIPMMNLDTGHYHFYVRVRDDLGRYSIAERQQFYIGPPPTAVVDTFGIDSLILPFNPGFILDVLANDGSTFPIENSCGSPALSIIEQPTQGTVVLDSTENCGRLKYIHTGAAGWDSLQYAVCDSLNLCDTASVFLKIYQPLDSLDEPVVLDELTFSWEGLSPAEIEDKRMLLDSVFNGELIESCNCNTLDRYRFLDSIGININEKIEQLREDTGLDGNDISFNYVREIFDPRPTWNTVLTYPENTDTGEPVPIAVIDSGVDSIVLNSFAPYLDGDDTCEIPDTLILVEWGYNALQPYKSPFDYNGHGTHIAEIVSKESNGMIELYFVKVVDSTGVGTMFHTICGIHKAINEGVKVINLSLGYKGEESLIFREVVDKAEINDVILVVSAGNDALDIDAPGVGYWPSNFEHPNIISVGANNPRNEKCIFSNSGYYSVDMFAPGRDILSRRLGGGSNIRKSGTSQAAALVSRQIAILRSQFPDSTYSFIKDTLFNSLDTVDIFMPLSVTGGILPGFDYTGDEGLPIELIYFTALPDDILGNIDLSWEVTTESTVDKFIVEYSRNAIDFNELTIISYAENRWDYTYTHADVQVNVRHYYRLKMVEPDGKISYSDIQEASLLQDNHNPVSIHPNPINEATDLKFEGFANGNGQLVVYDTYGRLLAKQDISIQEGFNVVPLNVNDLSAGVYILQLLQGEYRWTSKFIKM